MKPHLRLRCRETLLAEWDNLNWRTKLDLLRRSFGAFTDALLLQPRRLKDEMFQDLRFGVRMLLRNPGFTFVATATLALGIGVNAALLTVFNACCSNRCRSKTLSLVNVSGVDESGDRHKSFSWLDYLDYSERNTTFGGLIA